MTSAASPDICSLLRGLLKQPVVNGHMKYDDTLDAIGLLCPLPVLKARKRLLALETGQVLRVEADDPAAVIDFPHFCAEQGHEFLEVCQKVDVHVFYLRKG